MSDEVIIGLDCDDLLLDLVPNWLKRSNKDNNENVKPSDIKDWDIAKYVSRGNNIYKYLVPDLYRDIEVVEGALLGINALRNIKGIRVIVVTSNMGDNSGIKFTTLNRLGFEIDKNDFFECADKSLVACHYLVDDRIENVNSAYGQGVLFTRSWNQYSLFTPRCNNWYDIIRFFRKEMNQYA